LLCQFLVKYGTDRSPNKTIQRVNDQLEWVYNDKDLHP
jgi:hypothetical protein